MKTLPNGLSVFNATPHVIRFWREGWTEPVEVEPDRVVSAKAEEVQVNDPRPLGVVGGQEQMDPRVDFVCTRFLPTFEGGFVVMCAYDDGADVVIGSIIAAQAYPGRVFAMTPALGYERVPPAEKRMNPDKFTVFS